MPIGTQPTAKIYKRCCIVCGREFETERHNVQCCSEECTYKHRQKIRREWRKKRAVNHPRSTLVHTIKELNEYNREHGTHLTYGKYKAMKFMEARG